jgi:AcrR family transcriptional regulator
VFALKGYRAASMEDIALAAGCSKGGLYHHFPTKARVLAVVVERLAARGALIPPGGPVATPAIAPVLLEIWAEAGRDSQLRAQLTAAYATAIDAAGEPLAALLRFGALIQALTRPDDAEARSRRTAA